LRRIVDERKLAVNTCNEALRLANRPQRRPP
jgi:hypothetical protein